MIGERLSELRKDHEHDQGELAKLLHVSISTVRSWEQDKSSPSHEMLVNICRLYNVSSDYLLGLSNVDPVYEKNRRRTLFSPEELAEIRDYEAYLLWKKHKK